MQSTISMVLSSTRGAFQALGLGSSYPCSLSSHDGVSPRRKDIVCCILIAVMLGVTLRASPVADSKREMFDDVTAMRAAFTAGVEAIHKDQLFPVPLTLVGEHLPKCAEARIVDGACEAVVFDHAPNIEVFNADAVKAADQIGCCFVEVILAGIPDLFLYSGNLQSLPVPPGTSFGAPGQNPLGLGKTSVVFARMLWVMDFGAVTQGGKAVDPQVHTHGFARWMFLLESFVKAQRNEVATAGLLRYRNCGWIAGELTAPANLQSSQPTDNEIRVVRIGPGKPEGRSRVFRTLLMPLLFEGRVMAHAVEEAQECRVQMPQRLLRGNTGDFTQPCSVGVLFPLGEFCGTLVVVDTLLPLKPSIGTQPQGPVVNIAAAAKHFGQLTLLSFSRVKPKLESNLHTANNSCVRNSVNNKKQGEAIPRLTYYEAG